MYKKFQFTPFDQEKVQPQDPAAPFQGTWPELEPRTYTSSLRQYFKGLEDKILKQAREKAYLNEREGYEKGFAQGEKDGLELGLKRMETVIQQFKGIILELEHQQEALFKAYEKEMVQLVLTISRKIIHQELRQNEEVIESTLREAFQQVKDRREVVVRLNPVDYRYLFSDPEKRSWIQADLKTVKIVEDPAVTRGGCLLETSFGDVDATIEAQLNEIASVVWDRFERFGLFSKQEAS